MKIEKGVKTRPQYNFLIKSYDKKELHVKLKKIIFNLTLLSISIYTSNIDI